MTQPSNTPTVENLLQLKRMERPGEDFWADFDDLLREKLLQQAVRPSLRDRVRHFVSMWWVSVPTLSAATWVFTILPLGFSDNTHNPSGLPAIAEHRPIPAPGESSSVVAHPETTISVLTLEGQPTAALRSDEIFSGLSSFVPGITTENLEVPTNPSRHANLAAEGHSIPSRNEMRAAFRGNFTFVSATIDSIVEASSKVSLIAY